MLELEDFSFLKGIGDSQEKEEKDRFVEIEEKYKNELLKLQASFREELEKVRKEAYRKGFNDGYGKGKEELSKALKELEDRLRGSFEREFESLKVNVDMLIKEFNREKGKRLEVVEKAISEALVEILEFLYINPSNLPFLKEKVSELIRDFDQEELLYIEVGKGLSKALEGEKVKVNQELGDYDFKLVFKDFSVISNFKEKLNLLREEVEREIKKAT